ncbi:MAG: PEF-CTERM sorting domain-containing protein [Candidatus Methanoperedens sp.]|nr:PEF-CTERM sorting domain-containing protein [Candidatus Methanoperedens sp.]
MKYLDRLIVVLLVLLTTAAVAGADPLAIDVVPIDNQVQPGGIATYKVNLTNGGTTKETFTNIYASDGPTDFSYVFSETSGDVPALTTKQIDLSVTVPSNKPTGAYTFDVNADWQKKLGPITIKKTANYLDVVLNVLIPEFPTVALPIISALGIVFLLSKRKERSW